MSLSVQSNATPLDALPPVLQEELSRILEEYLADLEQGIRRDPGELIEKHPDLAEPLKLYLGSLDFLHNAAAGLGSESPSTTTDELPYKELGDFRVKREIGRGGMGVVYEAEQISIRRRVALKVLPFAAVLDQKQIARFNNEAQAAGQLNHPNIVPVYSVGCERGVHFYSMQFIDGQPLDRAIEDLRVWSGEADDDDIANGLATTQALEIPAAETPTAQGFSTARSVKTRNHIRMSAELAIEAAEALHHAHEFGIVHRDVKPSNLLVDRQGKLWVTDFGLARFQEGNNITMTGDVLGTARYMSPEQAAGRGHLVDQRSDIFSLGVTLYELLTLQHPFGATDRQSLLRQIEHDEPQPLRRVNSLIPVDLETIVLKATSKSRDDRYESAQELADDLRRFLDGKPTLATRPSLLDRATKWAERHRTFVASTLGVLLLGLGGVTIAAVLLAAEKEKTEQALADSEQSLTQSQANLHKAIDVVDRFGMRLASELKGVPGMEELRRTLLEETLHDYEGFVEQLESDPSMRFGLALSHSHMASMHQQLGNTDEALADYEAATRLYSELSSEQPDVARFQHDLAICHNNVGDILFHQGDVESAVKAFDAALSLQRGLVRVDSTQDKYTNALAATLINLGNLQRATNQLPRAKQTYNEAVDLQQALCESQPDNTAFQRELAVSFAQLAFLHSRDDINRAERFNQEAIAIHERLVANDPTNVKALSDLATCYNHRGSIFGKRKLSDNAIKAFESATAVQERLVQRAPTIVYYQEQLAVSYNNLGQMLVASSAVDASRRFTQSKELLTNLVAISPHSPRYRSQLGGVLANLGPLLETTDPQAAREAYEQAIVHQESALQQAPQITDFRNWLSSSYVKYGRFLRRQNDPISAGETAIKRRTIWAGNGKRLHLVAIELAESAKMLSESGAAKSQQWIDETVSTLQAAVAAGFMDMDALRSNPKFEVLADNERFQELVDSKSGNSLDSPATEPKREISP